MALAFEQPCGTQENWTVGLINFASAMWTDFG